MAPRKVIPKPKVTNILVDINLSKRSKTVKSKKSVRHYDEAQPAENSKIPLLNDDCLLDIFSHLPIKDLLYKVALCSHHFKALAYRAVQQKCRDELFTYACFKKRDASIVKRFGEFMREIVVYDFLRNDHSFGWLKHCTSLKTLDIQNMKLNFDRNCVEPLKNLHHLSWDQCFTRNHSLKETGNFLLACRNLKSITIEADEEYILSTTLLYVSQLVNIENVSITIQDADLDHSSSIEIATKICQMNNLKFLMFSGNIRFVPFIDTLSVSQSLEILVLYVDLEDDKCFHEGNFTMGLDKFPNLKICEINCEETRSSCLHHDLVTVHRTRTPYDVSHLKENVIFFDVVEGNGGREERDGTFYNTYVITFTRKN